ncbi:MAG: GNAT family N-acetyltransferase [Cyclobacteriaceae bacterium]
MGILIREASIKDFTDVYQFICELQGKVFDERLMKTLYSDNILNPNYIYLVAMDGNDVVGYASCHIQNLLHHGGKVAEAQEMFVKTNYRSNGVGKHLMNEVKKMAKQKGALQLEVTTRAIREKAIQFYIRESFEDSHKKLVYYF